MSGPNVMAGYWERADATRDAIDEDGWLRTGDAARIDDEEFVWIVDRVDDAYEVSAISCTREMSSACSHSIPRSPTPASCHGTESARASSCSQPARRRAKMTCSSSARRASQRTRCRHPVTFVDRLPRSSVGKLLRLWLAPLAGSDSGETWGERRIVDLTMSVNRKTLSTRPCGTCGAHR